MKLIILGKTTEEKGAELEKVCSRLFIKLGYKNITLNAVGSGAAEYDVCAEKIIENELGQVNRVPVFAECKAYKNPCNNEHWQKFLGKYAIESAQNSMVEAYFVALSGVNGNVWKAASDYISKNDKVHLIAKDQLIEFLEAEFHLLESRQIREIANLYSNRAIDTIDIVLLNNSIYWLIRFNSTDFTLFSSDNSPLTQEDFNQIKSYFKQKDYFRFVDLIEEKERLERVLSIKGFILTCALLEIGDSLENINSFLKNNNFDFSFEDIVQLLPDTDFVSDSFPFELQSDIRPLEFIRYLYSVLFFGTVLTSELYQSFFTEEFLDDILILQGDIALTAEQRKNALFLLSISPGAVYNVIYPNGFLVNSSRNLSLFKGEFHTKAKQQIVAKFFSLLIDGFRQNMTSQPYWEIAKGLGVENYSFSQSLLVNEGLTNGIVIESSSKVLIAEISNLPTHVIAPVVMLEEPPNKENLSLSDK